MLVLRLRGHLDEIALTTDEVTRLVEELRAGHSTLAGEEVADVLETAADSGTVGLPLTERENAALLVALDAIGAAAGELSTGLALLRQEIESDAD